MRLDSHAFEQYRRTSEIVRREPPDAKQTQAHARTTTTAFGFSLGKFGVRYEQESTQLDPSLSRDVRKDKQRRRAFEAESEVENLRAAVGRNGAVYRDGQYAGSAEASAPPPTQRRIQQALSAYARADRNELPSPGAMLAGVV